MTTRTFMLHVAALAAVCHLSCGDSSNADCDEARPPAKTRSIGEECLAFHYGSCPTLFTDCAEGTCTQTANGNGWQCLAACSQGCVSGTSCKDAVCWPRAVCTPSCTAGLCCDYTPCADDPTTCCRTPGSCL